MTTQFQFIASTPLGGNRGVLSAARSLLSGGEAFALAIVVSTRGSTYRKPGALALVANDGTTQGVISGGCLEPTLQETAAKVLAIDAPQTLLFDTQSKDDLVFGSGSACRGVMQVLLVPVRPGQENTLYSAIDAAHHTHVTLKLALATQPPLLASGLAWSGDSELQVGNAMAGLHALRKADIGEHSVTLDSEKTPVAVFESRPAPQVLLIGAGPEAAPLMRIARSLGWFITLIDHRPAAMSAYSVDADRRLMARPLAALAELKEQCFDAALIMTHTAAADLEALQALAPRTEPYVGLLGPPARRDELMAQLSSDARDALKDRLHAPLGLRLGGDGPEPLALSIAAELQRFLTQQ